MTYDIQTLDNGVVRLSVDFADEGSDITGVTHIHGDINDAARYLPVFEADLRHNNSELQPKAEEQVIMPEGRDI